MLTEETISKESLQAKLDAIKQATGKRQWKYYHLEAIDNFIYHLHNLTSERTQQRLAKHINDYLSKLKERLNEEHDLHALAKELFLQILKIADNYKHELGFIKKPSYPLRIAFWIILFLIFNYNSSSFFALGMVVVVALTTTLLDQRKIKARKYY